MISDVSQEQASSRFDDAILTKGPDLHNLQPGNIVAFQDWYSLPQSDRDWIDVDLRLRGLKLLPFHEEQFHVICCDTSPEPRDISPTLFAVQPDSREITIRGVNDVSFRVTGTPSDEAAFVRVREVLALFKR